MKKSLILVPLAVAIVLGISPTKATNPKTQAAVVVMSTYERYQPLSTGGYTCNGIGVYFSSSSSNAPSFPLARFVKNPEGGLMDTMESPGLAEAMVVCLDAGMRLDKISPDGKYIFIRP